jgi:transcriptional regulator with GAF, ATPase, and Fis domain
MKYLIIKSGRVLYAEDYSHKHIRELSGKAFQFWTLESDTTTREGALTEFLENRNIRLAEPPILNLDEVVKAHIIKVLEAVGYNQIKAATYLGLSRHQLWSKIARLGIKHESWRKNIS